MAKKLFFIFMLATSITQAQEKKATKVDGDQIFTCFKQGNHGDCVSIGMIKAAISVFGMYNVFSEKPINDTLTEITLRNGKKYSVSLNEFYMADTIMHIRKGKEGIPEVMQYATRCFAVMGKVKQDLENVPTYEESINKLARGGHGKKIFYDLGLENNVVMLGQNPDFSNICGVVAWKKKHVAYICNGYMDKYGNKVPVTDEFYGGFMVVDKQVTGKL
ncbi:hypothetical protein [Parasediminibacterium sp. JCM 36343]|uniref:hypothetical protein n=1 Tax=Parasediminibacterium sp. JCM 36343 TaxID=3374279 RepID=UPI00397836CA